MTVIGLIGVIVMTWFFRKEQSESVGAAEDGG
jgi:hypothetical protein